MPPQAVDQGAASKLDTAHTRGQGSPATGWGCRRPRSQSDRASVPGSTRALQPQGTPQPQAPPNLESSGGHTS